jgi:hypothetical protein
MRTGRSGRIRADSDLRPAVASWSGGVSGVRARGVRRPQGSGQRGRQGFPVRGQSASAGVVARHRTGSSFLYHIGKASCQIGRIWLLRRFGATLIVRLLFVVAWLPQCSRYVRRSLGARPLEGGFPADPFLMGCGLEPGGCWSDGGPLGVAGWLTPSISFWAFLAHVPLEADVVPLRKARMSFGVLRQARQPSRDGKRARNRPREATFAVLRRETVADCRDLHSLQWIFGGVGRTRSP